MLSFSLSGTGEIDLSLVAKRPGPAPELDTVTTRVPLTHLSGADPLPPFVRLADDVVDKSLAGGGVEDLADQRSGQRP